MDIREARAFVVVHKLTREVVSHELTTAAEGEEFMKQIEYAEGPDFEVIPIA